MNPPPTPQIRSANVLSDVAWIRASVTDDVGVTQVKLLTVRDALLDAHHLSGLDLSLNGIEYGAQIRFLCHVAAVVIRVQTGSQEFRSFRADKFDASAVDAVIEQLSSHADVFHPTQPFLQIPVDKENPPSASVKKLLPYMPADRAEEFWESSIQPESLELPEAVHALVIHNLYSFGGNSKTSNGIKCVNGSPGIRFLGIGNTVTEVFWNGSTLLDLLAHNIPASWIAGVGLPAWADPQGGSALADGQMEEHPLWRATWGSNIAQCKWDGTRMTAVSVAGNPHRPPRMGSEPKSAKEWWDLRNMEDPFYLYRAKDGKGTGERQAQRIDFGYVGSRLEAEWHSKNLSTELRRGSKNRAHTPGLDDDLLFLRHLPEGASGTPVVRRSEIMIATRSEWQVDEQRADAVADAAEIVKSARDELCKPFSENGRLGAISKRRTDVEAEFWRRVTQPFEEFILHGTNDEIDPEVWPKVRDATLSAFDTVAESVPHSKLSIKLMAARHQISFNLIKLLKISSEKTVEDI